ncbi:MAG: DUF4177 domain-containing protein [Nitrospinaceae bacterium]|nr:MAG: DUF4177 domain-containing protein [Nitrospinaceae bacterium]
MTKKEFKVLLIKEGAWGTLFLGASKLPIEKLEDTLNDYGEEGWGLEFMVIESHRFLLFWAREAAIVTLSRERG